MAMSLLISFLFCGFFCLFAEMCNQFFHMGPKWLIVTFLILGGVLAPMGITNALQAFGGGGMLITIAAAGNVCEAAGAALMAGNVMPTVIATVLFSIIIAIGAVFGAIKGGKKSE